MSGVIRRAWRDQWRWSTGNRKTCAASSMTCGCRASRAEDRPGAGAIVQIVHQAIDVVRPMPPRGTETTSTPRRPARRCGNVEQSIVNLLTNAIIHAQDRQVRITWARRPERHHHDGDNGIVSPQRVARIFGLFARRRSLIGRRARDRLVHLRLINCMAAQSPRLARTGAGFVFGSASAAIPISGGHRADRRNGPARIAPATSNVCRDSATSSLLPAGLRRGNGVRRREGLKAAQQFKPTPAPTSVCRRSRLTVSGYAGRLRLFTMVAVATPVTRMSSPPRTGDCTLKPVDIDHLLEVLATPRD